MILIKDTKDNETKVLPSKLSVEGPSDYANYITALCDGWVRAGAYLDTYSEPPSIPQRAISEAQVILNQRLGNTHDEISIRDISHGVSAFSGPRRIGSINLYRLHSPDNFIEVVGHGDFAAETRKWSSTRQNRFRIFQEGAAGVASRQRSITPIRKGPTVRQKSLPGREQAWFDLFDQTEPTGFGTVIYELSVDDDSAVFVSDSGLFHSESGVQQWPMSNLNTLRLIDFQQFDSGIEPVVQLHPVAREFSNGAGDVTPDQETVTIVDRIIRTVIERTEGAEYSVDEDGALSFEATLSSGQFIMCEVSLTGNINTGLYHGADGELDRFLARPTVEQLLGEF